MTPLTLLAYLRFPTFPKVGWGILKLSPHGLATVAGFAAGARLMRPDGEARGISREQQTRMLTRAGIGAVVGARAAYVVNHLGEYDNPLEWLAVWHGGISLFGGIAGAVLAAYPVMRRLRFPLWTVLDAAAPGLALGIVVGRVGDLIVGDHLGKPTRFPLGFVCPRLPGATASPCDAGAGVAVHLPALYDLVSVSLLLTVLLVLRRRPHREGFMITVFATWYAAGRLAEDFTRIDVTHGLGLTGSQWTSVALIMAGLVLSVRRYRHAA